MAKSPISCGTSCNKTVNVVTIPVVLPAKKEAPIAKPSVKLCAKSAAKFRYPATLISSINSKAKELFKIQKKENTIQSIPEGWTATSFLSFFFSSLDPSFFSGLEDGLGSP